MNELVQMRPLWQLRSQGEFFFGCARVFQDVQMRFVQPLCYGQALCVHIVLWLDATPALKRGGIQNSGHP